MSRDGLRGLERGLVERDRRDGGRRHVAAGRQPGRGGRPLPGRQRRGRGWLDDHFTGGLVGDAVEAVEDWTGIDVRESVEDATQYVGEALGGFAYDVVQGAGEVVDDVTDFASDAYDTASEAASDAYDYASDAVDAVGDAAGEAWDAVTGIFD